MPENPRLSSLGMHGILSKRNGGFFRHGLARAKVMPGRPAFQKPWALAQGGSFISGLTLITFLGFKLFFKHPTGQALCFP
jgi:hypothetical protein